MRPASPCPIPFSCAYSGADNRVGDDSIAATRDPRLLVKGSALCLGSLGIGEYEGGPQLEGRVPLSFWRAFVRLLLSARSRTAQVRSEEHGGGASKPGDPVRRR